MAKALAQQMNIRIDGALKAEGDSVLESLGFSPSEAVRAFYEVVVKHRYDPSFLASLLSGQNDSEALQASSENPKLEAARKGRSIVSSARTRLGITERAIRECGQISDRELLEEALFERMVERGLA